ncbi:hypothetical protein [Endozoicomonas sp. 8E]|uniref:hypothetical protein n=1 Tax=Endozoicomonas sp. 8E TaxID=3035692 RepID=UPI0029391B2B|nr:hypothetical protein [Endozoicomonas sp. 8E]WOG29611.1 hypothetical protein P6910_08145 [Endozoicomonas sp. 8E]
MKNARPNALSLAVVVAISSSIIATQALADRRLQTKSFDIQGNKRVEFTWGEVRVQPTLDDGQQPIPKSFTTTYPDRTQVRADYDVPSEGFTDILSDIEGGVSSIDLFETDDNDIARKYTKVLKVGNEGIFRFTHNLAEKKLVIEVRDGMTDQDSIEAIRNQSGDIQPLDPLTMIASPEQLAGLLKGANERAGKLGKVDDYVALATIEVDEVEVNGRTFMRLVAAGDEPPELQRLGQSLFINDEALLAAATSAYTQVHVLGNDLQQEALNELLSCHKPVGYVVHVEDETQVYPLPAGYPKLEVDQVSGEMIVFRGQKQNPTDIAFVESHYDLWNKFKDQSTQVKKDKVKSYQYVIRSRQMELLEEFAAELAAQNDAEPNEDLLSRLAYYESLQQALASATPDGTDEFEFTTRHIRDASSVIKPIWVQFQLIKNFNFKPVLKNLLTHHNFVQNIQNFLLNNAVKASDVGEGTKFSSRVMDDIAGQMLEMVSTLEKLRAREAEPAVKQVIDATTKARNAHVAAVLGMNDWDDTWSLEEQARLLRKKIDEINRSVAAIFTGTEVTPEQAVKNTLAVIEGQFDIVSDNENDLGGRSEFILKHLQQQADQADEVFRDKLTIIEGQLGLPANKKDDLKARQEMIQMHLWLSLAKVGQQPYFQRQYQQKLEAKKNCLQKLRHMVNLLPTIDKHLRDSVALARVHINTQLGAEPGNDNWDDTQLERIIGKKILETKRSLDEKDATTTQPWQEAVEARLAPIDSRSGITLNHEDDLDTCYQSIQQQLQQKVELNNVVIQNSLTHFESMLGLVSDNRKNPEVRRQAIQQHLKRQQAWVAEQLLQHEDSRTDTEIKARYATIAVHLNIQDFDSNTNVDAQQEHLLQTFKTMKAREEGLRQQLKAMRYQLDIENFYKKVRKEALAVVLGIDPAKDTCLEDPANMESKVIDKLSELSKLKIELEDIKTPGHPKLMPEVLEKIRRVLIALEGGRYFRQKQSVYVLRQFISVGIDQDIREARKRSEEKAHSMLDRVERLLNIEINEGDYKTARLERILAKLDAGDISKDELDGMHETLSGEDRPDWEDLEGNPLEMDIKRMTIRDRLNYIIKESDQRAREQQASRLIVLENELDISPHENPHAIERGKSFTAKLASDLEVEFKDDANLSVRQYVLRDRIQELRDRVSELYEDESARRIRNNKIAHQLNIKDYKDDARIDDQNRLIAAKLQQLDKEVLKAGQPDVNERIAAIDDELERQIARLGPKPRYRLDRDVAIAKWLIAKAEIELAGTHRRLNRLRSNEDYTNAHGRDESHEVEGELLLTRKKYTQVTGGGDGTDDKIRHLVQEQAHLEDEIEIKKADIERLKEVLKAAERAIKHDGSPFQYLPKQVKVRTAMHAFVQQNSLRKQALETAMGLAELAAESGKTISYLPIFDFDDEFAPNHLQAMVGDQLTLKQASRIVEVFKSLKTTFPESSTEPVEALLENDLKKIFRLVHKARHGMKKGAQEYDDEIRSMSKTALHFIQHQSEDLKSFPEYFAPHSASGNKIISLLHEGLISKVELKNYIKSVRGVEGYQTVDEFEHFLGYEHGVKLPEFRKVIQLLSDKDAREFIQSVFTPVPKTASGPAAMKKSIAGIKEYAAAVIANYVLDDIAFDNGRRTAAFLANVQDTLTPYANAVGLSETELIKAIHGTLMQAHAAAVEYQLNDYWGKPSAFLVQAVTWYFSSYKPLLATHTTLQAAEQSLLNMSFLYLLDLANRGDYLHRMLIPFQNWLERFGVDLDRTGQYAYHRGIEKVSELGGLAMPLGKAASSVILLRTGAMLFARQHNANPQMYRSISRLVPELVKSMGSGQGVQVPLLHRATPQNVKTLASATAALVLGPVATVGAYAHGLISGFTYAQSFGFALASSLAFDFFMNDNKMLTQWLGGPLGRSLDKINRWAGVGETTDNYVKRTTIARPQCFDETDAAYANHVKANNTLYGWTRHENYLHFRERRDRTMKLFENGWEKYFRENVPEWSFSHAESIPYSYTLGALYGWVVE